MAKHILLTAVIGAFLLNPLPAFAQAQPTVPLFNNLGTLHHPITTKSDPAQKYFDQGLRLVYGFNHEEAINSLQEAARQDPQAAMPYWGIALALGPNVNAEMDKAQERRAIEAIKQAKTRLAQTTQQERAYIDALSARYSSDKKANRKKQDQAYADAMRQVSRRFPDDADAAVLFAEALMDTSPWDYWTADSKPKPGLEEIVPTLEQVLAQHPDHPGACHYYIHAVEASSQPERALPCAQRLPSLMPGAGHLVHMPSHIYMRLGLYKDAVERNVEASDVDQDYLDRRRLTGDYPHSYYLHNIHFLWAALLMEGRSTEAARAARRLVSTMRMEDPDKVGHPDFFAAAPMLTLVRFGRWDELLREPAPRPEWRLAVGLWHYARGLALAATERFGEAEAEQTEILESLKLLSKHHNTEAETEQQLLKVAERVAAGELAIKRRQFPEAIRALKEAVALEDKLRYNEPPLWTIPARQNLGAVLMTVGRPIEAEGVYREDLKRNPENGWSLFGLAQSLRTQDKMEEARAVEDRFRQAWTRADVKLTESRF
jgi:tetratricopeptide (TPR) repeat protein